MKRYPIIFLFALIYFALIPSACNGSAGNPSGQIIFDSGRYNFSPAFHIIDIRSRLTSRIPAGTEHNYDPSFNHDGKSIVYASTTFLGGHRENQIYSVKVDGSSRHLILNTPDMVRDPVYSPDGSMIAFQSVNPFLGDAEIFIMGPDGSNPSNLTDDPGMDNYPVWSPDGTKIAFTSNRSGNQEIYVMNADGTNQINLSRHPANDFQPSWSPDGNYLAFTSDRDDQAADALLPTVAISEISTDDITNEATPPYTTKMFFEDLENRNLEIYIMGVDGSNQVNISNHPSSDSQPAWSPDGDSIAFVSNRDGNQEIYIMKPDGSNQLNITNHPDDDYSPAWKPQ